MRNIALLEWGPASLFYIQPRELIKVRTRWLEGGPVLPPFLSTMEEAKAHDPDLTVRYALSAFEDLNSAIKNLRRCFGFPYQEYIGYMNTLTHQYRTRREHEGLIDRIRRWAMFGNVDAVLWIDYAKANQPPGSFKMGPRESRPFSPAHMQICADMPEILRLEDVNDESEAAWSEDLEDDKHAGHSSDAQVATMPREPGSLRPLPPKRLPRHIQRMRPSQMLAQAVSKAASPDREEALVKMDHKILAKDGKPKTEKEALRMQLQEEVVPVPGSIYTRSIVPGPGYYGAPKIGDAKEVGPAASFARKGASTWDQLRLHAAKLPGPGQYEAAAKTSDTFFRAKLGSFTRAPKLVNNQEVFKKLPFISNFASACEGFGLNSPEFHCISPEEVCNLPHYTKDPAFSFSRTPRP
ncbi:unnamed protein product [Effrenium voratum]|uniref:Uncharacterized protein n=1 Tax=Effrenium voratum TaxID=2562239 RepID=A0AA36NHC5_9DINO|nr:unnamed protein product [Effrenium voratum]CAJ1402248.1 unnamed protein product [Effrenium voratum]CAJ1439695.1 unnamed protein product [Effrenium voratum]